ncbi:hypothetical protein VNO78_08216 [Psophocarpus tetragonolobus]|uniref:Uncharacterized protein n=1 Tax=Psophocarpus tetragonolobus TaxID=3891 RepID=A0AAN9SUK3_PSOTE
MTTFSCVSHSHDKMSLVIRAYTPLFSISKDALVVTVSSVVFNVATSIIDVEIISLPTSLKVLGLIPMVVLIVVIVFIAKLLVEFLMSSHVPAK